MALKVSRRFPICEVEFLLPEGAFKAVAMGKMNDDLLRLSTSKQMGTPSGSFQLSLVPKRYMNQETKKIMGWEDIVIPNALVYIRIYDDKNKKINIMTGMVDDVSEGFSMSGGKPQRSININGRDFGKILEDFSIYYLPWFGNKEAVLKGIEWGIGVNIPVNASPADAMNVLMKRLLTDMTKTDGTPLRGLADISWIEDKEINGQRQQRIYKRLREIFKTRFEEVADSQIAITTSFFGIEGQFWDMLKSISDSYWYELFVDSGRDVEKIVPTAKVAKNSVSNKTFAYSEREITELKNGNLVANLDGNNLDGIGSVTDENPILYYRRMPFIDRDEGTARWDELVVHEVAVEDIEARDLSRSSREFYTMYQVTLNYFSQTDASKWALGSDIFSDKAMAEQFGFRIMQVETVSMPRNPKTGSQVVGNERERATRLAKWLADWYIRNPYFYSGTYTIKGNPNIRIGERLRDPHKGLEFYVQGVRQTFENFGTYKTYVDVVRGWDYTAQPPTIYGLSVLEEKGAKQYSLAGDGTMVSDLGSTIQVEDDMGWA